MTKPDSLLKLETVFREVAHLSNALGILHWDQQTMMPDGAADVRADTVAALEVMQHARITATSTAELLDAAEADSAGLGPWDAANLREMRRAQRHATAVPADLVAANVKAVSKCEMVWRSARPAGDFAQILPSMTEVLAIQRDIGQAKAAAFGVSIYDALLDSYEPGGSSARIDDLFDDLAGFLPDFIESVLEKQAGAPPLDPLEGPFPTATQKAIGERLMTAAGFDFDRGRLDVSLHPFCGGADDDQRITTRYDESDFSSALMGVMHETGHALYEQGLPPAWRYLPVGESRGMGVHESQSLIIEMQACRSPAFIGFLAPILREAFGRNGSTWTAESLQRRYTRVERSFIRVDADEVTYPAHVILRYRLERAMLAGDLALADLPGAWNDGMKALVGVVPPDDRLGCLQDIHWPGGAWGYFPTYTLGALAAAQLFDAATRADSGIEEGLARGDFGPLVGWLRTQIHSQGSLHDSDTLIERATGRPLGTEVFKAHLKRRYLDS